MSAVVLTSSHASLNVLRNLDVELVFLEVYKLRAHGIVIKVRMPLLDGVSLSMNIEECFEDLLQASDRKEIERIIQYLLGRSIENIDEVIDVAIKKIRENKYDGSKWSTLAFSISHNFDRDDKVGRIFEELIKKEPENPAHLNNLGVNHVKRKLFSSALRYFARAYAIDYDNRGHDKASELPAWKNLVGLSELLERKLDRRS